MEALIERAAGLDVHQGSVVACIILSAAGRRPSKEVRSFGTMRQDLAALRAWLLEKGGHPRRHGGHGCLLAAGACCPGR